MRNHLLFAVLLANAGPAGSVVARADVDLRQWTMSDGLPQSSVTSVVESRDGYLWIGTFGGLARFDGHRFTVFSMGSHPGLGSDRIVSLHEDRAGDLWIGHDGRGVTRLSAGLFTHFPPGDAVPGKEIWTIVEDRQGRIWVGGEGVARWDGERFERVELPAGASWNVTWSIVADPHDGVWATTNDGLWRIDARGPRLIPHDLRLSEGYWRPWRLHRDPQDRIWLYTPEALHEVLDETLIARRASEEHGASVRDMLVDRRGRWWMVSGAGLFRSGAIADPADASWQRFNGIDDSVRCVFEDGEGNIWIGTDLLGLFCVARRHHRVHAWSELDQTGRFSLAGHGEHLWAIRTWPKPKAVRLSVGAVDSSVDLAALGVENIGAALAAGGDTLWLADGDDVVRVRDRDVRRHPHALPSTPTAMIEHDGDLWCGGAGYVARFDGERFAVVATFEAAADEAVRRFAPGDAGRLWFITDHALYGLAGERLAVFDREDGIPRSLRALDAASNGDVWVGGYGSGLARLRGGSLLTLTTDEGLPDNAISFIGIDDGTLWVNSNRGVFRFTLGYVDALERGEIDRLRSSRFDTGEANQGEGWHAEDGTLYLPTLTGLVAMSTRQLRAPRAPTAYVESVTVGARAYAAATASIELPPGERDLTFLFSAPKPADAGQMRFRYRLDGYDEAWSATTDAREVMFRHLPAGAYRFEVAAADGDGPWSPRPAVLELAILPFFHETWWFRAAAIGVGALALIMIHRYSVARTRERDRAVANRLIEAQETERRRISLELHDDISQRLAALALTVSSLSRNGSAPELIRVADEIRSVTTDVHSMSRQLHPSVLTNLGLAEAVRSECRSFSSRTGLQTEVHVEGRLAALDEQHTLALFRILQEAMRNAQKHAGSPSIRVDLRAGDDEVRLRVIDAGRGFDTAAGGSRGLGLRSMEERARHVGGTLTIESRAGTGTTVNMRLPCKPRRAVKRGRLVLADDHRVFLEGLRGLLEPEFDVVACVESGELIEAADRHRPDIVVTDVSMPGLNGILATRKIKTAHPEVRVILLTMHDEVEYAVSALEAGASAYVLKQSTPDELRAAIREVAAGRTHVAPAMAGEVFAAMRGRGGAGQPELSERHLEILRHLADGKTAKEIAARLGVSRKTVEYHKYRLAEMLGVSTTAELIRFAVEHGIADR